MNEKLNKPKTIFIDIDGTILKHNGIGIHQCYANLEILPGVLEKFEEWDRKGHNIILVTGRKESDRKLTEKQLRKCKIPYDKLIMGIGGGQRVLINDYKENSTEPTALAFCVTRNAGIKDIEF